jgi:hypothetical protein
LPYLQRASVGDFNLVSVQASLRESIGRSARSRASWTPGRRLATERRDWRRKLPRQGISGRTDSYRNEVLQLILKHHHRLVRQFPQA